MEYLRSLFGSLQQALDFVSSFTTYLFGNEPHPGAEEVGSGREMKESRSHHDSEVETTYSGDVSPREELKVTEGPFTAEIPLLSEEIQGTSEIVVTGDQAMESFLRSSNFPNSCEGQEKSEQKFSVSSVCLSDTPELESTTPMTDSIEQFPLEAPSMTGRFYQRKSEEFALVEVAQEDMTEELEDAICSQYCSQYCSQLNPDELLAERRELGQMEEARKTEMSQEAEQDRNVLPEEIEQEALNWAASVEQKRGLEGTGWTGEMVQGSMEETVEMDNQQLEVGKEQEEENVGEKVQGEINTATLNQAEDKVLEEERTVGESHLWDEEAEKITDDQEKELGNMLWNKGIQQKLLDLTQHREEKQRGQEDATWSRGTQQGRLEEMAKMARDQQLNVEKEQEEDTRVDGNEQVKPSVAAEIEGDQVKMLEEKRKGERSCNLEECLGGTEEGKERKLDEDERELERITWTNKLQYDALNVAIVKTQDLESGEEQREGIRLDTDHQIMKEVVTKNEEVQQPLLHKAEMETSQKKALEGEAKERDLYWEPKETEIMIKQESGAPELEKGGNCKQGDLSEKEERGLEGVTWTDKFQYDALNVAKVKTQGLESGEEQGEGIELDADHQIMKEIVTKNEEVQQPLLDKAEMETSQKKALEGEEKERDLYWEPKETEIMIEQESGAPELEKGGNCKQGDLSEKEERGLEGVTWTDKFQYDALNVAIVKTQGLESGEEQGEGIELDADHQIMKEIVTKNEEVQQPLLDKAEMETSQKKALEGEEKERDLYWEPKETDIMIEQEKEEPELEKGGNCKQGDLPEKAKTEENLNQEVEESVKNEILVTGRKQEQQMEEEWWESNQEEQPELLVGTCGLSVDMLEVAETTSDQSNQLGETTKNLVYPTSLDTDLLAGPRAFPHDVTTLDSSAQKERVLLRRKSSIRRAPSLKKPKISTEAPTEEIKMAEDAPSLLEVPKRQKPRLSGFGPMHPNMMAELQMRLQKPK
ncbi:apolipoprotein B receptor [Thamnophis elegans]|uniref:apolipoprotein B receptor n=1 Tax=Thamnophis elegans TaxID=35005 RepID=UPI0013777D09|nr:apolipoprotein B receptor [Thamnophis elegans]XP_032092889.1 apolipoprotein B receptor [Thamnophis elegans]XP_032092890.1 apolipoprotein B receptor [Thamnophis elegans]XP_032092891.1 apolipoprotein B receptor [Thamnophis elegans]XP_032092892.1 apolipoprotein B receptor [Thamnophis elegans]